MWPNKTLITLLRGITLTFIQAAYQDGGYQRKGRDNGGVKGIMGGMKWVLTFISGGLSKIVVIGTQGYLRWSKRDILGGVKGIYQVE